jgi:serine/threonine-protein kinase
VALPARGQSLGGYVLEELIGRGGMGAVYRARGPSGEERAVKVARLEGPEAQELALRFERETLALSRVPPHRNVLRVHAAGNEDGVLFCVLDLLEGSLLQEELAKGAFTVERALATALGIARALAHVHAHGLIHRDVTPSNVMLRADGSPVLIDFGLARDLDERARLTETGAALGTPNYMSPEQASGRHDLDARVDIYGAGAVLYALLAGGAPFPGSNPAELLRMVCEEEPAPLLSVRPELPGELVRVVTRAMAPDRKRRHATAAELAHDLERLSGVERRVAGRGPLLWALAGVVVTGAIVAVAVQREGSLQERRRAAEAWRADARGARESLLGIDARYRRARIGLSVERADLAAMGSSCRALVADGRASPEDAALLASETDRVLARATLEDALAAGDARTAKLRLEAVSAEDPDRELLTALVALQGGEAARAAAGLAAIASTARGRTGHEAILGGVRAHIELGEPLAALDALAAATRSGDPEIDEAALALRRRAVRALVEKARSDPRPEPLSRLALLAGEIEPALLSEAAGAAAQGALAHPGEELEAAATRALDALEACDPGALARPEVARFAGERAAARLAADDLHGAALAFARALLADPRALPPSQLWLALHDRAQQLSESGRLAEWVVLAVDLARVGFESGPEAGEVTHLGRGQVESAVEEVARTDWAAKLVLGELIRRRWREDRLALSREESITLCERGAELLREVRDDAHASAPVHALASLGHASCLLALCRFEEAAKEFELAARGGVERPAFALVQSALCWAVLPGHTEHSLELADEALACAEAPPSPDRPRRRPVGPPPLGGGPFFGGGFFKLAVLRVYVLAGRYDDAERLGREVASASGKAGRAELARAEVLYAQGRPVEAGAAVDRALDSLAPAEVVLELQEMAEVFKNADRRDETTQLLVKARAVSARR